MTEALRELATAYGVAVEYWDWRNQHVQVSDQTLVAVLAALDVDAATPDACAAALRERELDARRRVLPRYVVVRQGEHRSVDLNVVDGESVDVWITLEDGSYHSNLATDPGTEPPREIDGRLRAITRAHVPSELPLGYHQLHAYTSEQQHDTALIVTPAWLGLPARLGERKLWGLATQLYSVRSQQSWGVGDLTDLTDLAVWSATEHGAGYVLVNPLHAAEPVTPVEPSPYLPTSRRFGNPIYLRIDRIPEYRGGDLLGRVRQPQRSHRPRRDVDGEAAGPAFYLPFRPLGRSRSRVPCLLPTRRAGADRFRYLECTGRRARRRLAQVARRVAPPAQPARRTVRCRPHCRGRLPLLAAVACRRAVGRRAVDSTRVRHGARHRPRPRRRRQL